MGIVNTISNMINKEQIIKNMEKIKCEYKDNIKPDIILYEENYNNKFPTKELGLQFIDLRDKMRMIYIRNMQLYNYFAENDNVFDNLNTEEIKTYIEKTEKWIIHLSFLYENFTELNEIILKKWKDSEKNSDFLYISNIEDITEEFVFEEEMKTYNDNLREE